MLHSLVDSARGASPVPDLKNHPQMLRFSNHKLYLCSKIK